MDNPWRSVSLSDYEDHMRYSSVMQLQTLNEMMKAQLEQFPVSSVMILGVAGGNGLEYIDADKYTAVYGVDINSGYLRTVKATPHNPRLAPLHVICLHFFRHSTQIFLAGRQPACVKFMHSDEKSDCASDAQGLCGIALRNVIPLWTEY